MSLPGQRRCLDCGSVGPPEDFGHARCEECHSCGLSCCHCRRSVPKDEIDRLSDCIKCRDKVDHSTLTAGKTG